MAELDSRIGVSLPMLNQPYERYPELATLAEEAGFDSLWDYEFFRNPHIDTRGAPGQPCRVPGELDGDRVHGIAGGPRRRRASPVAFQATVATFAR